MKTRFILLRRLVGGDFLTDVELSTAFTLHHKSLKHKARIAAHNSGVPWETIKRLTKSFQDDPSDENFEALKNAQLDIHNLQVNNRHILSQAKFGHRHFLQTECAPFISPLIAELLESAAPELEKIRTKEEMIAAHLGLDYVPSGNVQCVSEAIRALSGLIKHPDRVYLAETLPVSVLLQFNMEDSLASPDSIAGAKLLVGDLQSPEFDQNVIIRGD